MTASEAGKGSRQRKRLVSQEEADKNWDEMQRKNREAREKAAQTKEPV